MVHQGSGIGSRVLRTEDDRHLGGQARFVGDIQLPGLLEVALYRSPVAHATIRSLDIPAPHRDAVFTADSLGTALPMLPANPLPEARSAPYPVLAIDRVRFVGEPIAACIAPTRAQAEDIAQSLQVAFDPLAAVTDARSALAPQAPLVHADWGSNLIAELKLEAGDDAAREAMNSAPVVIEREYAMSRQTAHPMEGKGCLAQWDSGTRQLILYTSTQIPHLVRDQLAISLALNRSQIRVIAPDVGGGFGFKSIVQPEEVLVSWLAIHLQRPVRWCEDRREHLVAGANTREHRYRIAACADRRGRLLGIRAEVLIDAGAYAVVPFTNTLDAGMAVGNLSGPYRVAAYSAVSRAVATHKPPAAPYRGVARPGACFALELLIDELAREVGREPWAVRLDNLPQPDDMPFKTVTGKTLDSGDYPQALRRAQQLIESRRRPCTNDSNGVLREGTAVVCYTELTGHGTAAARRWRLPVPVAAEPACVQLEPDGSLEIRIGMQSHGQGMETTMAQVAHEILGVPIERIRVMHGDTALTPHSTGTYASRAMVMAGGAVAGACQQLRTNLLALAGTLLHCEASTLKLAGGVVSNEAGSSILPLMEIARAWQERPDLFERDRPALAVTHYHSPASEFGAFSYGAHAARVAVDTDTGHVTVIDYVVVEDCGTRVNPMIVEGQVIGGVVQGIGSALFEESPYSADGQPLASTLLDYLLPAAGDVPAIHIEHLEHPSPFTEFGIKGAGEGGAIPSAAVVVAAINDALHPLGAVVRQSPATPRRILSALLEASALRGDAGRRDASSAAPAEAATAAALADTGAAR